MVMEGCNVFQKLKQQNKWKLKIYLLIKIVFVYFLLGDSLTSEFHVPTFRNTLSVPTS